MATTPLMAVISPAKTLDFETPAITDQSTDFRFADEAAELIDVLRTYSVSDVRALMSLSEKLAALNVERFSQWQWPFSSDASKQAILAFKGDVYTGLDAETLGKRGLAKAQERVRILSGLYGLLRPLDRILPYRLEMGTRLRTERGSNLYQWWGSALTETLDADMRANGTRALVNLASNEYFKAIQPKQLSVPVIVPEFRDWKNGQYKMISFFAKKARGMMVRYMLDNDIRRIEDLKGFTLDGYAFDARRSTDTHWQFLRDQSRDAKAA